MSPAHATCATYPESASQLASDQSGKVLRIGTFNTESYWRPPALATLPSIHDPSTSHLVVTMDELLLLGDIKEAWEAAKLRAAKALDAVKEPGPDANGASKETKRIEPFACRFHDLKHTAVSRMLDAGVPIAKVAKIVGWSPATMVRMAARYGHFGLEELRSAVESISRPETDAGSPVSESTPSNESVN